VTINSNNFKESVQSDRDIDPGLHNSVPPSTRATHCQETNLLFSPAQWRIYYLLFFTKLKPIRKKEKGDRQIERALTKADQAEATRREIRTPPSTPGRRRPKKEMLDVAFRKGITLDMPTMSSQEGKRFHPHRRNRAWATSYASMASLVRQPMTVASNTTVALLANNQGGHRRPRHHDTTSTSPHPSGRPPSRTLAAEAIPTGTRHPPPWPSSGRRG
jgi:hypothetical protein